MYSHLLNHLFVVDFTVCLVNYTLPDVLNGQFICLSELSFVIGRSRYWYCNFFFDLATWLSGS